MARPSVLLKSVSIGVVTAFVIIGLNQYRPESDGPVGFPALSQVLAASEQPRPYVTTTDVNVRSGPGMEHEVITMIKSGTKVNVVGREGEWLKIVSKHGNPPGFILDRFARPLEGEARPTPVEGSYVTTTEVNVRSGPGTQYSVVAKIPKDTKIQVVGAEGDWLKVQSKQVNPPGYVFGRYARPY